MPHVTSLRLPDDVFEDAKSIFRSRGVSFNAFVEEVIRREIAAEQEHELYDAATLLGSDPDSDVDYAFAGQSEVAVRD